MIPLTPETVDNIVTLLLVKGRLTNEQVESVSNADGAENVNGNVLSQLLENEFYYNAFFETCYDIVGEISNCGWANFGYNGIPVLTTSIPGCTYSDACNFNENAIVDDGSCYYANEFGEFCYDGDGDGFVTDDDNCPNDYNPSQDDTDGDGVGDECDDCMNLLGDPNDDMIIDILDIVTVVNMVLTGGANSPNFTDCAKTDADMTEDGNINILDVIQILSLIHI